ncbi:ABC transporter substrate-binding protein [Aquabacter sp. CN5-332]|uniref:ABC transporter substrate-binding protein n=1 Tax=Aquabacter sp. CN5-332 TaxID=3156608 RepID=UPI0032B3C5B9
MGRSIWCIIAAAIVAGLTATPASAETNKLRLGVQYGLTYLVPTVMEREKLIEAQARKAGLGEIETVWVRTAGGPQLNDAILSGNLDLAFTGSTSFLNLWDKSRGKLVRALFGYGHMSFVLATNNPNVKTVADFTSKDRIAVPAVGSSTPAMFLQMAAEKAFGPEGMRRLDPLTVSRAHPDAMTALFSNTEITAHFASPPFVQMEAAHPGIRKVLQTEDVVGQPVSNGIIYTTEKFYADNPRLIRVFRDALQQAVDLINTDAERAAQIYLAANPGGKITAREIVDIIKDPSTGWEITPLGTMVIAKHMKKTGQIQSNIPEDWKEFFFPIAHDLPGN